MYYNLKNIHNYIIKNDFIAKKNMGQNFLWSEVDIKKIIAIIRKTIILQKPKVIIEIGPGFGALTKYLLDLKYKVFCIEYDFKLVDFLKKKFEKFIFNKQLIIFSIDIEKLSLYSLIKLAGGPVLICGNLPYHLSKTIINKIIPISNNLIKAIFLIQEETTEKIIINSKNKNYNVLSSNIQFIFKTNFYCFFDKSVFWPVPKVNGSIITLVPNEKYYFNIHNNVFKKIICSIFIQKRKTLKNALKRLPFLLLCCYLCDFNMKKRINFLKLGELLDLSKILKLKIENFFSIDKYYYQ